MAASSPTVGRLLHTPELSMLRRVERQWRTRSTRRISEGLIAAGLVAFAVASPHEWATEAMAASLVLLAFAHLSHRTNPGRIANRVRDVFLIGTVGVPLLAAGGILTPAAALLAPVAMDLGIRHRGLGLASRLLALLAVTAGATQLPAGSADAQSWGTAGAVFASAVACALMASRLAHDDGPRRTDAVLDPLTGLLNPAALDARLTEIRGQAALDGLPVSIVLADLDALAAINAADGYDQGDAVIARAAEAMRRSLRSFELLYRLGGDEFLLVLPGATVAEAAQLAERMRDAVLSARPHGYAITASFGVAGASATARTEWQFSALLAEADVAMYGAKAAGGDQVKCADGNATLPSGVT